jgi:hypothetical protein
MCIGKINGVKKTGSTSFLFLGMNKFEKSNRINRKKYNLCKQEPDILKNQLPYIKGNIIN